MRDVKKGWWFRLLELIWAVLVDQLLADVEQKTTAVCGKTFFLNCFADLFRGPPSHTHEC